LLLEISSSIVAGGIVVFTRLKQNGSPTNDAAKIKRIFENARLTVNEDKKMKTPRLHRKTPFEGGKEYVYQLPLGMSFKQIQDHKHVIEDGLNVRQKIPTFELKELKQLRLRKDIIKQIRDIVNDKKVAHKEVVIDFDGMLRIKVYNESLTSDLEWEDNMKGKGWKVPVGKSRSKFIHHDFEERSHMIVAGSTGYGKSVYLKMLITSLIMQQSDNVSFSLIDLKGGTAFSRFKNAKQVINTGNDPEEAGKVLKRVQKDMNHKLKEIVSKGFEDVKEAREKARHFVVIDEAADIAKDDDCMNIVTDIARRGRAAGYRLIYATQYPTNETLPSQVRQNIGARVCFVLETNRASLSVLDESGAEDLPEIPGRAIYKRVKKEIVQTPQMTNAVIKEKITPHIVMKARDEGAPANQAATEDRKYTLKYEKA
jgi:hypothetical protein